MNASIDAKIAEIVSAAQKPFNKVVVRIECPLETGIKVECWRMTDQGKLSNAIPGGVRVFFQFVDKIHKEEPQRKFNVVEITADGSGKYETKFSFDEAVQRQAEENIRQE